MSISQEINKEFDSFGSAEFAESRKNLWIEKKISLPWSQKRHANLARKVFWKLYNQDWRMRKDANLALQVSHVACEYILTEQEIWSESEWCLHLRRAMLSFLKESTSPEEVFDVEEHDLPIPDSSGNESEYIDRAKWVALGSSLDTRIVEAAISILESGQKPTNTTIAKIVGYKPAEVKERRRHMRHRYLENFQITRPTTRASCELNTRRTKSNGWHNPEFEAECERCKVAYDKLKNKAWVARATSKQRPTRSNPSAVLVAPTHSVLSSFPEPHNMELQL